MSDDTDWDDLKGRLQRAEAMLRSDSYDQLHGGDEEESKRLMNKASGVALALSYMHGYTRR